MTIFLPLPPQLSGFIPSWICSLTAIHQHELYGEAAASTFRFLFQPPCSSLSSDIHSPKRFFVFYFNFYFGLFVLIFRALCTGSLNKFAKHRLRQLLDKKLIIAGFSQTCFFLFVLFVLKCKKKKKNHLRSFKFEICKTMDFFFFIKKGKGTLIIFFTPWQLPWSFRVVVFHCWKMASKIFTKTLADGCRARSSYV